jgi:hypothetical protein
MEPPDTNATLEALQNRVLVLEDMVSDLLDLADSAESRISFLLRHEVHMREQFQCILQVLAFLINERSRERAPAPRLGILPHPQWPPHD